MLKLSLIKYIKTLFNDSSKQPSGVQTHDYEFLPGERQRGYFNVFFEAVPHEVKKCLHWF